MKHILPTLVTVFVLFEAAAHGQIVLEEWGSIIAADPVRRDHFGSQVAISGNNILVGSFNNDEGGENSGAVYIYDATTLEERFKFIGSDTLPGDHFGSSIGVSGNIALIGAYLNDAGGHSSGAAYLFDITTGEELFKLTAADASPQDLFGLHVAISGNIALVGAVNDDEMGAYSGSAYLFDVTTGQQIRKFTASETSSGDAFGSSVAISGNRAIVGAHSVDDETGAFYVFDVSTGQELFKLTATDGEPGDRLGWSVAISGTTVIAGTIYDQHPLGRSGSAYLFDINTGLQLYKIFPNGESVGFGSSVAISETTALVGAYSENDGRGAAYYFNAVTGQQRYKLMTTGLNRHANFGDAVALNAVNAVVAASNSTESGETGVGSIYLFDASANCNADYSQNGILDFFDVSSFLGLYATQDPAADINSDGEFSFLDVTVFIDLMLSNCN